MNFVALETGLKFDDFSKRFWGHPRSWEPSGLVVNSLSPGFSNNCSRILETDSRDPETETRNPETEKRAHRIHSTLET